MKVGNLSQTAWRRSVLKQLHTKREESVLKLSAGERCSAYRIEDDQLFVTASASVSGISKNLGLYAVATAVNHLSTRGAVPLGIEVSVLMPEDYGEQSVKKLVGGMETLCSNLKMEMTNIQLEVNPAVTQVIVRVDAIGTAKEGSLRHLEEIKPNQDIVLCGSVGLEGILRILDEREKELKERFVPTFLRQTKALQKEMLKIKELSNVEEATRQSRISVSAMQQIGSGGIFATLWEVAEEAGIGLEIDMQKILIRQETVEICEYYHLNPYKMTSAGCILLFTDHGEELVKILEESGARAIRLGSTTAENARVITSGSETRYIDRPTPDELMLWRKQ